MYLVRTGKFVAEHFSYNIWTPIQDRFVASFLFSIVQNCYKKQQEHAKLSLKGTLQYGLLLYFEGMKQYGM